MTATIIPFPVRKRRPLPRRSLQELASDVAARFQSQTGRTMSPGLAEQIARAIEEAPPAKAR